MPIFSISGFFIFSSSSSFISSFFNWLLFFSWTPSLSLSSSFSFSFISSSGISSSSFILSELISTLSVGNSSFTKSISSNIFAVLSLFPSGFIKNPSSLFKIFSPSLSNTRLCLFTYSSLLILFVLSSGSLLIWLLFSSKFCSKNNLLVSLFALLISLWAFS